MYVHFNTKHSPLHTHLHTPWDATSLSSTPLSSVILTHKQREKRGCFKEAALLGAKSCWNQPKGFPLLFLAILSSEEGIYTHHLYMCVYLFIYRLTRRSFKDKTWATRVLQIPQLKGSGFTKLSYWATVESEKVVSFNFISFTIYIMYIRMCARARIEHTHTHTMI